MCLSFLIFQSLLKRWGYSWDRISWKGRLVVGLVSLLMFVVPIKILHIKWTRMREEQLLEDVLRKAGKQHEQVTSKLRLNIMMFNTVYIEKKKCIVVDHIKLYHIQDYDMHGAGNRNHLDEYCGCRNIAAMTLGININTQSTQIDNKFYKNNCKYHCSSIVT